MAHSSPSSASEMKGSSMALMAMSPQRILISGEKLLVRSQQIDGCGEEEREKLEKEKEKEKKATNSPLSGDQSVQFPPFLLPSPASPNLSLQLPYPSPDRQSASV